MKPYVIRELQNDLLDFGECVYSITDIDDEFSIKRYPPWETFYRLEI